MCQSQKTFMAQQSSLFESRVSVERNSCTNDAMIIWPHVAKGLKI